MYYKYTGNIGSYSIRKPKDVSIADIVLYNCSDQSIAPTRLEAYGGLAEYINRLGGTDDEERYLTKDFYYDANLTLAYIVIPSFGDSPVPAKVIAGQLHDAFCIFGSSEHINTSQPEPMRNNEYGAWLNYKYEHFRRS